VLRKPRFGARRKAKNFLYDLTIFDPKLDPESAKDAEHPYDDDIAWLRQWVGCPASGHYLVEGDQTYPLRIWRGEQNDINAFFTCIWERTEDD